MLLFTEPTTGSKPRRAKREKQLNKSKSKKRTIPKQENLKTPHQKYEDQISKLEQEYNAKELQLEEINAATISSYKEKIEALECEEGKLQTNNAQLSESLANAHAELEKKGKLQVELQKTATGQQEWQAPTHADAASISSGTIPHLRQPRSSTPLSYWD